MDTYRGKKLSERRRRERSDSPTERIHSRDKPRNDYRSHDEKRRHKRKEKETEKIFDRDRATQSKIEGKAREKLSVLSKLGIELKLPEHEKKKKLWSDKKEAGSSVWNSAHFGNSKANAKFKRLMGIREETLEKPCASGSDMTRTQAELFEKMEEEYEVARLTTHNMRGVGLGFPK